jgi:alginate O-acetyltransferase complex protein AlgJ
MSSEAAQGGTDLGADVAAYDQDKVVEGKDGWLFLARDTNHVIHQHTGRLQFSRRQLEDWRHVLETRAAWLGEWGIPYVFMVPPNSHAVYPENLPDDVVTVAERPILQLQRHLRDTGSDARIIYPLEELRAHKQRDLVYIATDTHWNELGAFIAYKVLMKEIAQHSVEVLDIPWERIFVSRAEWPGDLGSKVTPERRSTQLYVDISHRQTHYAFDNRVMFAGRRVEYTCRAAPPTTCLVHGDSFTEKIMHFLGESFARVVFCQMPSLDFQVVTALQPDVVIGVLNERFLFQVAYDSTAPTQADLEAAKRLAGKVYAPRPPDLKSPRVDSFL